MMSIQFHVWKTLCKKPSCLKINIFFILSFYYDKVAMQEFDIYVAMRGQSPNKRMIVMCSYFNTLCFVGKKNIKTRRVCVNFVNFAASLAKETIVTKTPRVFPA